MRDAVGRGTRLYWLPTRQQGPGDVIYLDMSKAFDKVSHRKLLRKLRDYGFSGNLLAWLESYLHDRMQRVTALGVNSQALPVTPGVSQGSILGPMLFLLYVNSLPGAIKYNHVSAFADDTKIFKSISLHLTLQYYRMT